MQNLPKVSVVTIVLNGKEFIRSCIESVLSQNYPNIEYIVKDGGSTDGTLDVLREYERKIKLLSGPDAGLYDAMNKGLEAASGDIIATLNADDFYTSPDAVSHMVSKMEEAHADVAWADLVYVDRNDAKRVTRRWKSSPYAPGKFVRGWHPPHPTFFVRAEIYKKYGRFSTDFKISADYEFMLRVLEKNHVSGAYLPETTVAMRLGGVSTRAKGVLWTIRREDLKAWRMNGLRGGLVAALLKPLSKLKQW